MDGYLTCFASCASMKHHIYDNNNSRHTACVWTKKKNPHTMGQSNLWLLSLSSPSRPRNHPIMHNKEHQWLTKLDKKAIIIARALTLSDTGQLWDLYLRNSPIKGIILWFISINSNIKASDSKSSAFIHPAIMGHTINPVLCLVLFCEHPLHIRDEQII